MRTRQEVRQHRLIVPIVQQLAGSFGETREQSAIENAALLVGCLAGPAIEQHAAQVRPILASDRRNRQTQGRRLHVVVIDDEIERRRPVSASQSAQREVFDPDTGMKQFRLMPGDEKRFDVWISDFGARVFSQIIQGGGDGASASVAAKIVPGATEERVLLGVRVQSLTIRRQKGAGLAQGRHGDDGAVALWGTRHALFAQGQVLLNRPDQQHGVASRLSASLVPRSNARGSDSAAAITCR